LSTVYLVDCVVPACEAYWASKLARKAERDVAALSELRAMGWRTLVIWECEMRDRKSLERAIDRFLSKPSAIIDFVRAPSPGVRLSPDEKEFG
jgi:G:T-mismatch repair DNA endonuclease (very short patch repair protein)